MTLVEALAVFGMTAVPDAAALAAAFSERAKTAHPDVGGSSEAMHALVTARKVLQQAEPGDSGRQRCSFCRGSGVVRSGAFGSKECASCEGTGYALATSRFGMRR